MKAIISVVFSALLLLGFTHYKPQLLQQEPDSAPAELPTPKPGEAVATFGGGCFWATQEVFNELKGVRATVAGYAGGVVKNPTYEQVGTDQTGHAECVQVYYDPKVIPYAKLVEAFFSGHDPTTLNRQGPDVGRDYRSIAFFRTPQEQVTILNTIKQESSHYKSPIVTEVVQFRVFYPAEKYHQNYYRLHPNQPYIQQVSVPKVEKFRKRMAAYLKQPA